MVEKQAIFPETQLHVSPSVKEGVEQDYGRSISITPYTFVNSTSADEIVPAISHTVHLSLAIVFTTLFALLFLMIIVQLFLILYFGHRRLSYQSVFLFIYLIWAALRTTLFSFYFKDSLEADSLDAFFRWLLFALPIYLQFLTLSVLTVYLAKVVFRTRRTTFEPVTFRKYLLVSFVLVNIIFLVINIVSAVVCPHQDAHQIMVIVRVVVNGLLFVLVGIVLCVCIIKITRAPAVNVLIEGQGATTRQGILLCILVVLLYVSRVIFNIVAVTVPQDISSFGFGWINVSDENEIKSNTTVTPKNYDNVRDIKFITFGVVLIVWEVLPTFMVLWFFRVRRPKVGDMGPSAIASQSYDKKSYFFDNPRRYDSDEDLSNPHGLPKGNYIIPGVLSPTIVNGARTSRSYGSTSVTRSGSFQRSTSNPNIYIPGTTPPQLFSAAGSGYQPSILVEHHNEE